MPYCSPNASFTTVWYDGGFNHCLVDSIKSIALAIVMGICGFMELRMYIKYGTRVDLRLLKPVPKLYLIQILLSAIVFVTQPTRFIFQLLDTRLYGYSIMLDLVGLLVWSLSIALIYIERNYDLPVAPGRGHSLSLVIFWIASLLCDTLELINVKSPQWWFYVTKPIDVCLLLLWFVQYVCELSLVIIGCGAPGIVPISLRNQFIYQQMDESAVEKQLDNYGSVSEDSSPMYNEDCSAEFVQSMQELRKGLSNGECVSKFNEIPRMVKVEMGDHLKLSTSDSKSMGNEKLNRYCNVLPYDYNRVKLNTAVYSNHVVDHFHTPVRNSDTDYINASYVNIRIPRLGIESKFIATQGPKPETLVHFWKMVLEQNIQVIVMLTGIMEGKVKKCEQYYPETIGKVIELDNGDISITCSDVSSPSKSYTIRQFLVLFKMPSTNSEVLTFWRCVREKYLENHSPTSSQLPPLLVHCSAGIGRTGVYILLDTLIIEMEGDLAIKPIQIVRQMRQQRMGMVQTEDQYLFACRAALDHFDGKWRKARL